MYNWFGMKELDFISERGQTPGEEIANSISHGIGLGLAITATPILIVAAARAGSAWNLVGVSVFATSMMLLYLASTLYHAVTQCYARTLGLDAVWISLVASAVRPHDESDFRRPSTLVDRALVSHDGLVGSHRCSPDTISPTDTGPHLVAGRRVCVHGRSSLFQSSQDPLQPLGVAFIRYRRNSLSLLRGPLVLVITTETRPSGRVLFSAPSLFCTPP